MSVQQSNSPHVLMSGLAIGESPRWHNGRLWFSNWTTQEIIAVDPAGNLYFETGNGTFDPATGSYSDSFIRLSATNGLALADYFTPWNQSTLNGADADVGSGGAMILPDSVGTVAHPHLIVGGSKAGTLYLLHQTRFGYFAAASIALGGLFSALAIGRYPGSAAAGYTTLAVALIAAAAIAIATTMRREMQAHVAMGFLVAGTLVVAVLVLTARVAGAYLDPTTHVPTGSAFPGYLRVVSIPFNAGGGLVLVFGALYSAYIYMPKRRALPARLAIMAVVVNFFASLPAAFAALRESKLSSRVPATILIAVGAFVPGLTSSLNRFGVTWSFFLGEFAGLLVIFIGFLVSEEVFRNVRLGTTLWSRPPSLEH